MAGESIDSIIEKSHVWIFDNIPGRGNGTDMEFTRLPPELKGVRSEMDDPPWTTTLGPYLLYGEKLQIEMAGRHEEWKPFKKIREEIDPDFPEFIGRDDFRADFIKITHGFIPDHRIYFILEDFYTNKGDEFGRPGTAYLKVLLMNETNYKQMLEYMRLKPRNVREVFEKLAPGLTERCTLPNERDRPIIFTYAGNVDKRT